MEQRLPALVLRQEEVGNGAAEQEAAEKPERISHKASCAKEPYLIDHHQQHREICEPGSRYRRLCMGKSCTSGQANMFQALSQGTSSGYRRTTQLQHPEKV